MELFATSLFWIVVVSILISIGILWSIKDPGVPRFVVFLSGALLISLASIFLGITEGLALLLANKYEETGELYREFKIASLIIPFYSAAIGANLISHAVTQHDAYLNSPSTGYVVRESMLTIIKAFTYPISILFRQYIEDVVRDHKAYLKQLDEHSKRKPWSK